MPQPDPAAVTVRGSWWRHTPPGVDPWRRPPVARDARWQRGSVVDALYLADSPDTAWADWYRWLAELAVPPLEALPRDLWRSSVDLPHVADLRDASALAAVRLTSPRPSSAEWPAFQAVGEALHADGWPALVAPSAARPAGRVLCVFLTDEHATGLVPVPPPYRVGEPPAPPTGLTT